ncbi:hypothetical protein [Deinococcus arcticus]|uniref:Uncharacterized protein n=1 Tax=Deinococcus arcticus TaxID=2136176 RepID=A0A2T3WCE7_9DEIO|nr:hypothetical protein [Deinococcus arcticus]PTA69403.1 hypothetical protein C8263_03530 [Deinococcus arcticus]
MPLSASDRAALWPALPTLPVHWAALPGGGVPLPGGLRLVAGDAPDGTPYLRATLHASEDFAELLDGRGDYTEEELDDPDAVMEERWVTAQAALATALAQAAPVLGEPARTASAPGGRVHWLLADRTVSLGLQQADRDCPIELCLWLLPPGHTPESLEL